MITQNSYRQGQNEADRTIIENSTLFAPHNTKYDMRGMQYDI